MPWLFLLAYTCSGFAGLVYEVTLDAAAHALHRSHDRRGRAVVAAFLGGLAAGAAAGGIVAGAPLAAPSLQVYIGPRVLRRGGRADPAV